MRLSLALWNAIRGDVCQKQPWPLFILVVNIKFNEEKINNEDFIKLKTTL